MDYPDFNLLNNEIDEIVGLHTDIFTERWSPNQMNTHSFIHCLTLSTCTSYVLISLVAISFQYHRRALRRLDSSHTSALLYGIFTHELQRHLDNELFEKVFADTAFIDACYEDNFVANDFEHMKKNMKFILGNEKLHKGGFVYSHIKTLPVSWFQGNFDQLDHIVNYCVNRAIITADLSDKGENIKRLGPGIVLACLMVDVICKQLCDEANTMSLLTVPDSDIDDQFSVFRILLSRFKHESIDHTLSDAENAF